MSEPLVSVVIPAFQAEETVAAAVRSALEQTFTAIEVIVVDDGSRDSSADIAQRAGNGDSRLTVVRLSANGGVSAARNVALDRACGKWIALLDADDEWLPNRLSLLVDRAASAGADLVADNLYVQRSGTAEPATLAFPASRMSLAAPVGAAAFVDMDRSAWGTRASGFIKPLMRRRFLNNHRLRYSPEVHGPEDFLLYVQALARGAQLRFIPQAGYCYAIRDESLSRADGGRFSRALETVEKILSDDPAVAADPRLRAALRRRRNANRAWFAYSSMRSMVRDHRLGAALSLAARPACISYITGRVIDKVRSHSRSLEGSI